MKTADKKPESAIDVQKHALRQAIKSIVPPPYILQVNDIEALRQSGWTETSAHIENERRQKEYEATVERLSVYINTLLKEGVEKERGELLKMVEGLRVEKPHREGEERIYEIKKGFVMEMKQALLSAFKARDLLENNSSK